VKKILYVLLVLFVLAGSVSAATIKLRRDSAADWTSADPTLAEGEIGVETDTDKMKVGDGSTAWSSLDYMFNSASIADDFITVSKMADGDWGDFTISSNVASLDANSVDSDQYTDGSIDSVHIASFSESTVLAEPDELQGISDAWLVHYFPAETYPSGVTIDAIHITTSATCTDALNFEEWTQSGTSASSTVEAITLSGTFTEDDGTLADSSIAADGRLMVDLDASPDNIAFMEITVIFHAN